MNCFYCITVCILCFVRFFSETGIKLWTCFVPVFIDGCVAFVMTSTVKVLLPQAGQLDVTCKLCLQDYPCCVPHDVFYSYLALFFLACPSFFHCRKELGNYFKSYTIRRVQSSTPHHSIFIILFQLQIERKHSVIMLKAAHIHGDAKD